MTRLAPSTAEVRADARATGAAPAAPELRRLGLVPYGEAYALQERLLAERAEGLRGDTLLLLEHPPVITLGRSGGAEFLHRDGPLEHPSVGAIELVHTDRGGKITYHGPGQLVGYGIVALAARGLHPASWAHLLEDTLIEVLAELGLEARSICERVGVWVGERKIASIGVRVRSGVAMHGFALNVSNELGPFELMDPCGLAGVRMTSTRAEGVDADLDGIAERVGATWARRVSESRRRRA